MKYIVKNCPAIREMITINSSKRHETLFDSCSEGKHGLCKDRTDCPIKQMVEICKKGVSNLETASIQAEILQILQVEEVE